MVAHRSSDSPGEELFADADDAELPNTLPAIDLNHGQAVWVLAELGFKGTASESTFRGYIKSLRKLGIPFARGEIGLGGRGGLAVYTYGHLMELALTLTLRVYHVVPDALLVEIVRYRKRLYRHYRDAYVHRRDGRGAPVVVEPEGSDPIRMRGVFLDLQINFSGGKLVSFGPPKALSPAEALVLFAERDLAPLALLPLNLSLLAERLVGTVLRAPVIRRGPRRRMASR
jgi:hypothetical protein